jgi:hypothetical protein
VESIGQVAEREVRRERRQSIGQLLKIAAQGEIRLMIKGDRTLLRGRIGTGVEIARRDHRLFDTAGDAAMI